MRGRWQPWHDGHQKLFEEILIKTGQVNIMVRDVQGVDDNPFNFETVKKKYFRGVTRLPRQNKSYFSTKSNKHLLWKRCLL